jgi:predicted Zn-dependent peptidase
MKTVKWLQLANKMPLILAPMTGTKTVTALVIVKTGSKYESRRTSGLSHFVEHMLFKGTSLRPTALNIASDLDVLGGDYNAFTSKEYTGYWVKVDQKKIATALEILADMLLNSKFEAAEIDREKGVILEEVNMYEDNPQSHIEDVFESCLYGDTPAGWDTIGTRENIRGFKRSDFINYLKTQYGVKGTYIVLSGDLKEVSVVKQLNNLFAKYPKNKFKEKVKVVEKQSRPALKIKHKKTDQAHLSLGVRTYPVGHPDEFILKLLAIILGGSMSSRLFSELRERRGLAYYIRTQTEFYSDSGYLTTRAGVPVDKIEEAAAVIVDGYRQLTKTLISQAELQRAKDLISGKLVIQMEASDNVANWYASQAVLRKKLISPEALLKIVNKITVKDIQRVAQTIFKDKHLNMAVIGPAPSETKLKKILHF